MMAIEIVMVVLKTGVLLLAAYFFVDAYRSDNFLEIIIWKLFYQ